MILETAFTKPRLASYDVCIVGGGVAGITLAQKLISSKKLKVCLLEAGLMKFNEKIQADYEGTISGPFFEGRNLGIAEGSYLKNSRLRYFGGSSNHWEGQSSPIPQRDFQLAWPITQKELIPFYNEASEILEIGTFFEGNDLKNHKLTPALNLQELHLSTPVRFASKYKSLMEKSDNLSVYLGTACTNLAMNQNKITSLKCINLKGQEIDIKAENFILATGGIENARILLNWQKSHPQIKNANVGNFFVDHHYFDFPNGAAIFKGQLLDSISKLLTTRRPSILPLLKLRPGSPDIPSPIEAAVILDLSSMKITDKGPVAALSKKILSHQFIHQCHFSLACGALPLEDSCVSLSTEKDALGVYKSHLTWKISDKDFEVANQCLKAINKELSIHFLGKLKQFDNFVWKKIERPGYHPSCTTRMGNDPKTSVVDKNLKHHNIQNLYVCGSSSFASNSCAHPTLTIVALALRLANQLKKI